ncbi:glycoside hydrolase family 13 protein [Streptomyces sp. GZWMJZ-114]|uniref:glycoside hydrolase family 13 protein n=1 Tax=Streptomyces sp. GZWMJZ-114 TaxID=2494734 RepID=UPI001011C80C|nr:glycoside hydrolase family 13 protein [Streptomyces sp. GZWMJZ-114]
MPQDPADGAVRASAPFPRSPARPGPAWWRDAVIYQVYVRSFADSDGDGVGDLRGVTSRLPYLAGLGVDAVWLTPFYASPQADGGYDVADYRAVDPLFGDLQDAAALIEAAHGHGLRVIVDVVPNHTSEQHPWFRAVRASPAAPERAYYVLRPGRGEHGELPPNDWESVFGGPAWTRLPDGVWYLHLFAPEQPDLNWEHPAVRAEFEDVLRFWLDLGVDGFRVDVAHGMVKAPGLPDVGRAGQARMLNTEVLPFFDQDGVHEIHRSWRALLDSYPGERIEVAEAWAPTSERLALYVRADEAHQAFNFQYVLAPWEARALREVIDASLGATGAVGATTTWVLSNHDVVRHTTRYAAGDPARGLRRGRAAALLTLALPGSVYVYQGEELGLPEVLDLPEEVRQDPAYFRGRAVARDGADAAGLPGAPDAAGLPETEASGQEGMRDGCRVPLPWSGEAPPYGFGPGGSWLPQPPAWRGLSVAAQSGDPGSTLELYRAALALRRELPGLGDGGMEWREAPEGVLLLARPGVLCALNTRSTEVVLDLPGRPLLASGPVEARGGRVVLPGDTCGWWAGEE